MRRTRPVLAVVGLAFATALGPLLPASSAAAGERDTQGAGCDSEYWKYANDGNVRAYSGNDCSGLLGSSPGNDSNWGNSAGGFRGSDNNAASSVLNTGVQDAYDTVAFYDAYNYDFTSSGYGCLKRNELYADKLTDNNFSRGDGNGGGLWYADMDDSISSHQWVGDGACWSGGFIN
ncbi:hypothetical protein GCM10023347_40440 [Streptomyces chumphonensis]|uniref:Secreted protein n=1 Tax=Streptomyces chumphonensis TaxID=1214925 RepID=A0A927EX95_9ACTN|nr:hypothetical protein [Streptomyces chumphonensis]MBD3930441.1 hypothetical protein [Streptomyces chumphonensis]